MHTTYNEHVVTDIFIPQSPFSEAIAEASCQQQQQRRESRHRVAGNPAQRINVAKKRQQPELSFESPSTRLASWLASCQSPGYHLCAPEEQADANPDEIYFEEKEVVQPTRLNGPRFPPGETPPFSKEASRGPPLNEPRDTSYGSGYNIASLVNIKYRRRFWHRVLIEYGAYTFFALVIYLVLIGVPLWRGLVRWLYLVMESRTVLHGGWAIAIVMLVVYCYVPLIATFEKDAPQPYRRHPSAKQAIETALIIPCFQSATILGRTLEAALKIFPASHIYVIANGDSSVPLDNTEEICRTYRVNHIWCPVGSKLIAIFVGCYAVHKRFRYVLLMDDDCILPQNFPVVASRLNDSVRCIGYTIKSEEASSYKGSYCQKVQDLEYKLAGLQRTFAGRIGSATFPHGAISLWEKSFLKQTLEHHPGYSISEDWFLGNSCRRLGGRVQMCSAVFVETTTPSVLFFDHQRKRRGGFGETTVLRQRFLRWNFLVGNGLGYNLAYVLGSWKLGKWEIGAKVFVFQEIYETIIYILTPFVLPISLAIRPWFSLGLLMLILGLYLLHIILFNQIHLRFKEERVSWRVVRYYIPYKVVFNLINVASFYWSLVKYARYFATRRPKLTENQKAVGVVLKLEMNYRRSVERRVLTPDII